MINLLKTLRTKTNEDGFTLLELMIVIVIISILAAIAIPIFANQQKNAISAGVKSDVKNTTTQIAAALVKNPTSTDVASLLGLTEGVAATRATNPQKVPLSDDATSIYVSGQWDDYTVLGLNEDADSAYCFISTIGKLQEGEDCSAIPGYTAVGGSGGGPVASPVVGTVNRSAFAWISGARNYSFPSLNFQIHEDKSVTVESGGSISYETQDGETHSFTGTITMPIHRAGPSISGADSVTFTVNNGSITASSGTVSDAAYGIATGSPGMLWIEGTNFTASGS